jgi:hypothetical protein
VTHRDAIADLPHLADIAHELIEPTVEDPFGAGFEVLLAGIAAQRAARSYGRATEVR